LRTTGAPDGAASFSLDSGENAGDFGGKGKSRSGRQDGMPSRQKWASAGNFPAASAEGKSDSSNWPITSPLAETKIIGCRTDA
jgi:hypothetical protein